MVGSVTVTGAASSMDAGRPVNRTGATSPNGRLKPDCGSASYSLT
jgi:hypothetical protein